MMLKDYLHEYFNSHALCITLIIHKRSQSETDTSSGAMSRLMQKTVFQKFPSRECDTQDRQNHLWVGQDSEVARFWFLNLDDECDMMHDNINKIFIIKILKHRVPAVMITLTTNWLLHLFFSSTRE